MNESVKLHWMDGRANPATVTWGVPWAKGKVFEKNGFKLVDEKGQYVPIESRGNAYWPDGSIKWSLHTGSFKPVSNDEKSTFTLEVTESNKTQAKKGIDVKISEEFICVDAGVTKASFRLKGSSVIENLVTDHKITVHKAESILIKEVVNINKEQRTRTEITYLSSVCNVSVESYNALQCVVKVEGIHKHEETGEALLPFVYRFIFSYGEASVRILHTFVIDQKETEFFLKGLGLAFYCPIEGELYNRHIKMGGDSGVFHETSQLLLSWRPRIDSRIYENQVNGELLRFDEITKDKENLQKAIDDITVWDSYRLYQNSPHSYCIKKSTGHDMCSFIEASYGKRAEGFAYICGEKGGFAIGMKDFWQKYPSSIWISGLSQEEATVTAWFWSYESEAMDFRHYDKVAHASAYYEGSDKVGCSALGIANTSELVLFGYGEGIISDDTVISNIQYVQKPAVLLADSQYYQEVKALGEWSEVDRSTEIKAWLEEELDKAFDFYKNEIESRSWYGMFHYGDFMHTYDAARHAWRYDMGGYAWQNTELVPTLWLTYAFLRTGREDIFTVLEAMNRHCSEVDTYHLGPYKGIGSRHNVIHWGCSCKEPRIAMAGHHRLYYYLTGDLRLREVFAEVQDGDFATLEIDPLRDFYDSDKMVYPTHARIGPDWSTYCSNWMTAWELGDSRYKDKIHTGIEAIKKAPHRLISGSDFEYDPATGHLHYIGEAATGGSHLTICMGGPQTWFELADMLDCKEWEEMLAEYGRFYFVAPDEKKQRSSKLVEERDWPLPYMASAMGMYAARYYDDNNLGKRVWDILIEELKKSSDGNGFECSLVKDGLMDKELKEIPWISTNFAAQWCLNVIVCLELGGQFLS